MPIDADYVLRRMALGEAVRERDVMGSVVDELVRRGCVVRSGYLRPPEWLEQRRAKRQQRPAVVPKPPSLFKQGAAAKRQELAALLANGPRAESELCDALGWHVSSAQYAAKAIGAVRAPERYVDARGCLRELMVYRMPGDARPLAALATRRQQRRELLAQALVGRPMSATAAGRLLGVSRGSATADLRAIGAVKGEDGLWRLPAQPIESVYELRAALAAEGVR